MKQNLNKKQMRSRAKVMLSMGASKQTTYEKLIAEIGHEIIIAKVIQHLPSKGNWKKYGIWNHVLAGLIILLFLLLVLPHPTLGSLVWFGLPMIVVLMKKFNYYFWITILVLMSLVAILAISLTEEIHTYELIRLSILLAIIIPAAFLAFWLPKKLTPPPIEKKEIYENENGEKRSKIVYQFVD